MKSKPFYMIYAVISVIRHCLSYSLFPLSSSRRRLLPLITLYSLLFTAVCLSAAGISTNFVNINVTDLSIDEEYNFTTCSGRQLKVTNRSDKTINVVVTPQIPQDNLKYGFAPVPDINWIKIIPNNYELGARQTGLSDVFLKIPKNKKLRGKKFQFNLEISGNPPREIGGMFIVPSLLSKITFSIEKKKKKWLTLFGD